MTPYGPQDGQPYPQQPPPPYGQPYAPQPPPQQHGQPYVPPQPMPASYGPPAGHAATPRNSQGLAVTSLVAGVVAIVVCLTPMRGWGLVLGIIAAVLAIVALIAKSQGGKKLAAGGLALGLASLPLAVLMYMWAADSATSNLDQQKLMEKCIEEQPENIIACADLD